MGDRVYDIIYNGVGKAVDALGVDEATSAAITKRVCRQLNKAVSDQSIFNAQWDEACKEFVDKAMGGYCSSCSDEPWFYDLNLVSTLAAVALEILMYSGEEVNPHGVWEICQIEFEDKLDRQMLEKALWDLSQEFFPEKKISSKVFAALSKAYWPALDRTLTDGNLAQDVLYGLDSATDLKRVEAFTRHWMDDAMSRAWMAIENTGEPLSEQVLQALIKRLIAPFGVEHSYSCLPGALIDRLGRPPTDWAYIRPLVSDLFRSWNNPKSGGAKKKPKRKSAWAGGEEGEVDWEGWAAMEEPSAKRKKGGDEGEEAAEEEPIKAETPGHPSCTSGIDCIGGVLDRLIQHMHKGQAGDIYCEPCWESFANRNTKLEGQFVDEATG